MYFGSLALLAGFDPPVNFSVHPRPNITSIDNSTGSRAAAMRLTMQRVEHDTPVTLWDE